VRIGIALVGIDYRLQKVNRALCDALGYSGSELLARTFVNITHPDDVGRDVAPAGRLSRGEVPRAVFYERGCQEKTSP
jgi:PAS domain S-box-containing protein